jgi:hypothetical protein
MQTIKTKSGRLVQLPSEKEEAAIREGIAKDPDAREWTEEDFDTARPASEVLPPKVFSALTQRA